MSPTNKRFMLRGVILAAWLLLALIMVGPALAQGGEGNIGAQDPSDLDDIAVRLAPLLVGAALIERTIEVLFTWTERALIDAGHWLNRLAETLTGLVSVDLRNAWDEVSQLTNALLTRRMTSILEPFEGNSDSVDPHDWPLAMIEERLKEAKQRVETAQAVMEKSIKSPEFVAQKKIAAALLSMVFGLLLAAVGSLRLFQPLGVEAADWFKNPFDVLDLVMAGGLMGLGTEWVHQLIGVLIKSKDALSRVGVVKSSGDATAALDIEQVRLLAEQVVNQELKNQLSKIQGDVASEVTRVVIGSRAEASSDDTSAGTRPAGPRPADTAPS